MGLGHIKAPIMKTVVSSVTVTEDGSSTAWTVPQNVDTIMLHVTIGTVSGTSPTCDIIFEHSFDGGTTYLRCPLRSTQFATTGQQDVFVFKPRLGDNEVALHTVIAATGGTLAKNFIVGGTMRATYDVGGTSPSFPVTIRMATLDRA